MSGWFGKKKRPKHEEEGAFTLPLPNVKAGTSYLGPSLLISGKITGEGDVQLHGRHEGSIDLQGDVTIHPGAVVNGLVAARFISVSGSVQGEMRAGKKITVRHTATVTGTTASPSMLVEEGAFLEGKVEMERS